MKTLIPPSMVFFLLQLLSAETSSPRAGPLSPGEALAALKTPGDLQIELLLAEPEVRQPVSISFDERGRLWVVQYLQYPQPAGLKMLSHDAFWRAVYDKVPPPPPEHFPGKDRITIHEDTDGDGVFDKHKVFLEGLNIATSVARGRGGVWILNPPYLLFYPDRDGDDVPDGPPEARLEGFGLEDTHSVVNSLTWGPDGWLYAAQGSTVSGAVRRPASDKEHPEKPVRSMGQLIWRYHPESRRYEVFAEGGGNAFGVEIDSLGRVFSGHNGGDTRGFHYVQGGYYQKGFSKHGPLSNPYAFGYFAAMKHHSVERFTHTFLIYEGGALPEAYRGKLLGAAPLLSHVVVSDVLEDGTSVKTKDVAHAVTSTDPWFKPVDIKLGPDGAVYVADWYDNQCNHYRNHEGAIDTSNGRIYRLKAAGAAPVAPIDLSRRTSIELVALLRGENRWMRQTALRLLGDRRDASIVPALKELIHAETGQLALEALWALNLSGGLDDAEAQKTLGHANAHVREWTVRLLGDSERAMPGPLAARLAEMALSEASGTVRSQLASTARRLPASQALPIVRGLLSHDEDADGIHTPLLLWWLIESKADSDRDAVLSLFEERALWKLRLVEEHILHRILRRYAAPGTRRNLLTCARLFELAPDASAARRLVKGFEEAFQGRQISGLPDELAAALARAGGGSELLDIRQRKPEAITKAIEAAVDDRADRDRRVRLVQVLGEAKEPRAVPALLGIVQKSSDDVLRVAALGALAQVDDPSIGAAVLETYSRLSSDAREAAQALLSSRRELALRFLQAMDTGTVDAQTIPLALVRKMSRYQDDGVQNLIKKRWGAVEGATTEAMERRIKALDTVVRSGTGSPYAGKKLFNASCAKCHRLFTQGGEIGPDLTPYKRDDLATLLLSVVNPSAEVREGFEALLATTKDGRVLTGFLADRDNQVLVLRGVDGQNVTIQQDDISELAPLGQSLMPEGLLDALPEEAVRDLFAYLRSSQPLNE